MIIATIFRLIRSYLAKRKSGGQGAAPSGKSPSA
jgi:hypothetical protein